MVETFTAADDTAVVVDLEVVDKAAAAAAAAMAAVAAAAAASVAAEAADTIPCSPSLRRQSHAALHTLWFRWFVNTWTANQ